MGNRNRLVLSNRNRLNWLKMTCNLNRLPIIVIDDNPCIKLGNLHPTSLCDMNRGFGGWVSSFIIVWYGYVWREAISSSVCIKSR